VRCERFEWNAAANATHPTQRTHQKLSAHEYPSGTHITNNQTLRAIRLPSLLRTGQASVWVVAVQAGTYTTKPTERSALCTVRGEVAPIHSTIQIKTHGANREKYISTYSLQNSGRVSMATIRYTVCSKDQAGALLFILLVSGRTPPVIFLSTYIQYYRALFTVYTGFP
jgi:hypothetical protein